MVGSYTEDLKNHRTVKIGGWGLCGDECLPGTKWYHFQVRCRKAILKNNLYTGLGLWRLGWIAACASSNLTTKLYTINIFGGEQCKTMHVCRMNMHMTKQYCVYHIVVMPTGQPWTFLNQFKIHFCDLFVYDWYFKHLCFSTNIIFTTISWVEVIMMCIVIMSCWG